MAGMKPGHDDGRVGAGSHRYESDRPRRKASSLAVRIVYPIQNVDVSVMAGLDPAIHASLLYCEVFKSWMAGINPAMTAK
jgi:hypothetical protein